MTRWSRRSHSCVMRCCISSPDLLPVDSLWRTPHAVQSTGFRSRLLGGQGRCPKTDGNDPSDIRCPENAPSPKKRGSDRCDDVLEHVRRPVCRSKLVPAAAAASHAVLSSPSAPVCSRCRCPLNTDCQLRGHLVTVGGHVVTAGSRAGSRDDQKTVANRVARLRRCRARYPHEPAVRCRLKTQPFSVRRTKDVSPPGLCDSFAELIRSVFGSWPSDHYFRSVCLSVCLFVCLFVQSFSQPSLIRFRSN